MLSVIFIVTIKSELRRSVKILIQGVLYTPKIRRGMMARLYLGTSLFSSSFLFQLRLRNLSKWRKPLGERHISCEIFGGTRHGDGDDDQDDEVFFCSG